MNIRQLIDEEISRLEENKLAELYEIVKGFSRRWGDGVKWGYYPEAVASC